MQGRAPHFFWEDFNYKRIILSFFDRDDFPGKSAGSTAKIPRAIVGTREMIAASFFTRNRIRLIVRPDVFRYEAWYHRVT